jgi:hypothetical protein
MRRGTCVFPLALALLQRRRFSFKLGDFRFQVFDFTGIVGLLPRTSQSRTQGLDFLIDDFQTFLCFGVHEANRSLFLACSDVSKILAD